jgi:hypothetical protein
MLGPPPVPKALRAWFVVHCVADLAVAVPLFFAPEAFLGALGWTEIDPAASRLVAAALFGIGIQSYLGRNEPRDAFRAMLNVKVIWSSVATAGLVWFQVTGGPPLGWAFVATFAAFHVLWVYWRRQLARVSAS